MSTDSTIDIIGASNDGSCDHSNNMLIYSLSLERCRRYVSHLRAIMHLARPEDMGMDEASANSTETILAALECEIHLQESCL